MKYFNFKRYKFSTIFKNISFKMYIFSRINKYINSKIRYFVKIAKYFNFRKYDYLKILKYFDFRRYNFSKIYKYFNLNKFKSASIYFFSFLILTIFVYLLIPTFYNYDKSYIESTLCKDFKIECSIEGKIVYRFFPSPRIKFKNLKVAHLSEKNKNLATIKNVIVKLPIYNLLDKNTFVYNKIDLNEAEINLDIENFKKINKKQNNRKIINLKNGEIKFFDDKKYIISIKKTKIKYKADQSTEEMILKGNFLDDDIYINYQNKKNKKKPSINFLFKLVNANILTKINFLKLEKDNKILNANILFKKDKNKITGIFDYDHKNKKVVLKSTNVRNQLLDGKLNGVVEFSPFFNFNLNLDLNGLNLTKVHNFLTKLDDSKKKKLFRVNEKINGQLNLMANKLYSKYDLIDSFESQILFRNGNILVEKMLLNLGKLGAADINGIIKNDKYSNFKFENNIFIDNKKYFYRKFGIYNNDDMPTNLFISGSLDLEKLNMYFFEISSEEKFNKKDIEYIEKEFNNIVLEEGYETFFDFLKLKKFIKFMFSDYS